MDITTVRFEEKIKILINQKEISLCIYSDSQGMVTLGIEAPKEIAVNREEIYTQKKLKRQL